MKELIFYILLSTSFYAFKEPYKPSAKQLCSRPHTITKPEKKQGQLFEKPIRFYEMPKYRFKTGFPLTGNDYRVIRL